MEVSYFDMGGWFPASLMNMIVGNLATDHMTDMCQKIKAAPE